MQKNKNVPIKLDATNYAQWLPFALHFRPVMALFFRFSTIIFRRQQMRIESTTHTHAMVQERRQKEKKTNNQTKALAHSSHILKISSLYCAFISALGGKIAFYSFASTQNRVGKNAMVDVILAAIKKGTMHACEERVCCVCHLHISVAIHIFAT